MSYRRVDQLLMYDYTMVYIRNHGTENYRFDSTCLPFPNSSMDREDLNRWWTQMDLSIQERSLEILPSTQPGDAAPEEQSSHEMSLSRLPYLVGQLSHPWIQTTQPPCFKREVLSTLKRKAAEQPLSVTQNILSEVLADSTPETNHTLPTMESLARVVQRSRAAASGSAQHTEATTSEDFLLPPTCTSTRRDQPFVLYDGKTRRNVRVLAFSTARNLATLAEYNNWIAEEV